LRELPANAFDQQPATSVAPTQTRRDGGAGSSGATLRLRNATRHNLKSLAVDIPLGKLVCVTGLSGSGKTTLIREVLLPCLQERLRGAASSAKASERMDEAGEDNAPDPDLEESRADGTVLDGWEALGGVALVDQSILGKTPRSNPAVYIGAFEHVRDFFAGSEPARRRGLNSSAFSFNSAQGQCERCRGAGFEKIEMQFLSDVFIKCPDCNGRRYREHILQINVPGRLNGKPASLSIFDLLNSTIEEAVEFLTGFPESRPAGKAVQNLQWLSEVGLGYLKLGQPINTLSGGESQRLKLVRRLADLSPLHLKSQIPNLKSDQDTTRALKSGISNFKSENDARPTLFLFDEPTTGLHFEDVRVLLRVLRGLVGQGHSVIVIEHNLDVIRSSDWVIDLGPGAGDEGGRLVAEGAPDEIARVEASETGRALR
jgi:excinuclease ABC subunit A